MLGTPVATSHSEKLGTSLLASVKDVDLHQCLPPLPCLVYNHSSADQDGIAQLDTHLLLAIGLVRVNGVAYTNAIRSQASRLVEMQNVPLAGLKVHRE